MALGMSPPLIRWVITDKTLLYLPQFAWTKLKLQLENCDVLKKSLKTDTKMSVLLPLDVTDYPRLGYFPLNVAGTLHQTPPSCQPRSHSISDFSGNCCLGGREQKTQLILGKSSPRAECLIFKQCSV